MKKLIGILLLMSNVAFAGTYTSKGFYKPATHESGWGDAVGNNFDIIDSSFALLSGTQTFTGTVTFTQPVNISGGIGGIVSIATGTNLAVTNPVTLTGSTLGLSRTFPHPDSIGAPGTISSTTFIAASNTPGAIAIVPGFTGVGGSSLQSNSIVISPYGTDSANGALLGFYPRTSSSGTGKIGFRENSASGNNFIYFQTSGTVTTTTFTYPANDGSSGQALLTNGAGALYFGTVAGGGGGSSPLQTTQSLVQITSPTATLNFTGTGINVTASGSTATVTFSGVSTASTNTWSAGNILGSYTTLTGTMSVTPRGDLGVSQGATAAATNAAVMYDLSASTSNGVVIFNNGAQTVGSANAMMTFISTNTAYTGYYLRFFRNAFNSAPDIRFDGPSPNVELVMNSGVDNTIGEGKWEPFAIANGSKHMQCGSNRAYNNGTIENLCEQYPLYSPTEQPGIYLHSQSLGNDGGILTSSDTAVLSFFTLNSHTVGITGPLSPAASYVFGLPSSVGTQGQLLFHNGNRGNNFSVRQTDWTTGGTAGQGLKYNGTAAPVWGTPTASSLTKAQIGATVPARVGDIYYCSDCTTLRTCISTGTVQGAFSSPVSATTACN